MTRSAAAQTQIASIATLGTAIFLLLLAILAKGNAASTINIQQAGYLLIAHGFFSWVLAYWSRKTIWEFPAVTWAHFSLILVFVGTGWLLGY